MSNKTHYISQLDRHSCYMTSFKKEKKKNIILKYNKFYESTQNMHINIHENFLLTRRKYITIVKRHVFFRLCQISA